MILIHIYLDMSLPAIIDTTLLFQHGALEVKTEIFICLEYIKVWFLKC